MYCKGLSKEELQDMGIVEIHWDQNLENWVIIREWYKNCSKTLRTRYNLNIVDVIGKRKYTTNKSYPKVSFSYKNKAVAIPLSRIVYVWFVEDVPDGYVVDHIDNNPYNCQLNNLRMMTIAGNLRKRFSDNPGVKCFNQYKNTEY